MHFLLYNTDWLKGSRVLVSTFRSPSRPRLLKPRSRYRTRGIELWSLVYNTAPLPPRPYSTQSPTPLPHSSSQPSPTPPHPTSHLSHSSSNLSPTPPTSNHLIYSLPHFPILSFTPIRLLPHSPTSLSHSVSYPLPHSSSHLSPTFYFRPGSYFTRKRKRCEFDVINILRSIFAHIGMCSTFAISWRELWHRASKIRFAFAFAWSMNRA